MSGVKRLGILTSGGDCAGLNAVIRAVTLHGVTNHGWTVVGIHKGTIGLMQPLQWGELQPEDFDGTLLRRGGTILGTTNKGDPFAYPMPDGSKRDRSEELIASYRELRLDALIGIGGDGSFAILRKLAEQGGFNLVGIPKTFEKDLGKT